MTTTTDYERAFDAATAAGHDISWARTGAGGHALTVYPHGYGPPTHHHYRRDGSAYRPAVCGCWTR
jgi:hypothetical protein